MKLHPGDAKLNFDLEKLIDCERLLKFLECQIALFLRSNGNGTYQVVDKLMTPVLVLSFSIPFDSFWQ